MKGRRHPVMGIFAGLFLGLGLALILFVFGILPVTALWFGILVVSGLVLGLVIGLLRRRERPAQAAG